MIDMRIMSCPRKADYLWMCVNAAREFKPIVCYDSEMKGPSRAFIDCLSSSLADVIVVIQDDFVVDPKVDGFHIQYLMWYAEKNHGRSIVSGYTHGYAVSDEFIVVDLQSNLKTACNGGCCWILRKPESSAIVEWSRTADLDMPLPQMIGTFCRESGVKYLITPENLGEHVGEVSSLRDIPYPLINRNTL